MQFSVIIPVYNRPDHIENLLHCFTKQTFKENFEIVIVESGSTVKSNQVVKKFETDLSIQYHCKSNEGPGSSRNYGLQRAKGRLLIILDSDTLIAPDYLEQVDHGCKDADAFGGPDALHPKASEIQKAIDFCMTSRLTTGGTRGHQKSLGNFLPRSFNMGFSEKVAKHTGGFAIPSLGEDLDLSLRIRKLGFKICFIPKAIVYHERKKSLHAFFKQAILFGRSRVHITKIHPHSFKAFHLLPLMCCLLPLLVCIITSADFGMTGVLSAVFVLSAYGLYTLTLFLWAAIKHKHFIVGWYAVCAFFMLNVGYTFGMLLECFCPTGKTSM